MHRNTELSGNKRTSRFKGVTKKAAALVEEVSFEVNPLYSASKDPGERLDSILK